MSWENNSLKKLDLISKYDSQKKVIYNGAEKFINLKANVPTEIEF